MAGADEQPTGPADGEPATVEVTGEGYVRLDVALAAERFPADSLVALPRSGELWLMPLIGPEGGGVLLKQRNRRGDRAALVREALPTDHDIGQCPAVWDDANGALRVAVAHRARGDTSGVGTGGGDSENATSGRAIDGRALSR
jgi:hypothetical protein